MHGGHSENQPDYPRQGKGACPLAHPPRPHQLYFHTLPSVHTCTSSVQPRAEPSRIGISLPPSISILRGGGGGEEGMEGGACVGGGVEMRRRGLTRESARHRTAAASPPPFTAFPPPRWDPGPSPPCVVHPADLEGRQQHLHTEQELTLVVYQPLYRKRGGVGQDLKQALVLRGRIKQTTSHPSLHVSVLSGGNSMLAIHDYGRHTSPPHCSYLAHGLPQRHGLHTRSP